MDRDDQSFPVEKLLKMRVLSGGKRKFLIKWEGWPKKYNSWEPEQNIDDRQLILDFEREMSNGKSKRRKLTAGVVPTPKTSPYPSIKHTGSDDGPQKEEKPSVKLEYSSKENPITASPLVNGKLSNTEPSTSYSQTGKEVMACGIVPDKIIGATRMTGELLLLMKWKDTKEVELIPATLANQRYPQFVINFYEKRYVLQHHFSKNGQFWL
ncbi:Chromobox protein 5 [Orchesella cincta]|uniref:Chromobox protein 5 n=1 Tax=Orchesella cincta TaxID=48709 RepID=A0A1D2N1V4_ORCCI|nr:Chromobox protein 5 [Orchesella cincta]